MEEDKIKTAAQAACNAIIYNGISVQNRHELAKKIEALISSDELTGSAEPEMKKQSTATGLEDVGQEDIIVQNEILVPANKEKPELLIIDETFSPSNVNTHLPYSNRSRCASCGKLLMAYNDRHVAKVMEVENKKYFICGNCLQNPDLNEIYNNIQNEKQRQDEVVEQRRSIQTVSYFGKSILTFILYYVGFFVIGFVCNIAFLSSANNRKAAGDEVEGKGCLVFLLWYHLLGIILILILVFGLGVSIPIIGDFLLGFVN